MKNVVFNKNCNGDVVLLSGRPKAGKSHCVSTIVKEALKTGKNVMWISSENVPEYLKEIYDELYKSEESFGKAYYVRVKNYVLSDNDITEIVHSIDWKELWPDILIMSNVSFGDYAQTSRKMDFFHQYCRNHNIILICSVQSSESNKVPLTMQYKADFWYEIVEESDTQFGTFKICQMKRFPSKEDIFIPEDNQ